MTHLNKFISELQSKGFDGALISSELNQRYLSDFNYTDGYILVTKNESYLITDSRYIEAAKNTVKGFTLLTAPTGMLDKLSELISDNKICKLAIEDATLPYATFNKFASTFSGCEVVAGCSDILRDLRAQKTEDEIARIDAAQKITDAAFEHILGYINPDRTEIDVALELEFFMRKMGAESVAFDTIAVSGPSSSLPHGVPSNVKLRRGFLTMDFGAKYNGYCSDMTRTVVIGKADEEIKKVYYTVLSAQTAALEAIHGGMACRDADEVARKIIRDAGFGANFGHSLGHGVGMFIHEFPSLAPRADAASLLKPGHIVTVEPGIYLEGKYGCRIEDMIAIKEDGSVYNFTKSPKNLIEL